MIKHNGHTASKAHIHKHDSRTIHEVQVTHEVYQRKHDTLERDQHGRRKQQKDRLACFRVIADQYPGCHGRYQYDQCCGHHCDHQGIQEGAYKIQFFKRFPVIVYSKMRGQCQHIQIDLLQFLKGAV